MPIYEGNDSGPVYTDTSAAPLKKLVQILGPGYLFKEYKMRVPGPDFGTRVFV